MTKIDIELSDEVKALIDKEMAEGGYQSVSDYFEAMLLRREEKRRAKAALEQQLLEGLASGSAPLTAEDWKAMRKEVSERLAAKKTPHEAKS